MIHQQNLCVSVRVRLGGGGGVVETIARMLEPDVQEFYKLLVSRDVHNT